MAASSSAIGERIGTLRTQAKELAQAPTLASQIALTLSVNKILRELSQELLQPEEKQNYLRQLQEVHGELCCEPQGIKRLHGLKRLLINTLQPALPPTTLSPAYNDYTIPCISTYHYISHFHSIVRCSTAFLSLAPPKLLEALGDYSEKNVELHSATLYAFHLTPDLPTRDFENHFNLCFHHWFARTALPGDDIYDKGLSMGIFPEFGIERSNVAGAVPFNRLGPMWIHSHWRRDEDGLITLYSPNNALFKVEKNSPFAICWAVAEKEGKISVSRLLILITREDQISASIYELLKECPSLETYQERLGNMQPILRFAPLLTSLSANDAEGAMREFQFLPDSYKKGILKYIPPQTSELEPALFLKATETFVADLQRLIVDAQIQIIQLPATSEVDTREEAMMSCAEQFAKAQDDAQTYAAFERFNALASEDKNATFGAFWEISGCPRDNPHFGRDAFYHEPSSEKRAQALLLASSRKPPAALVPVASPSVPAASFVPVGDPIMDTAHRMLQSDFQERTDEERAHLIREILEHDISAERVAATVHLLLRTFLFPLQSESTSTQLINDLLDLSPDKTRRDAIHQAVWETLPSEERRISEIPGSRMRVRRGDIWLAPAPALKHRPFSGRNYAGYDVELLKRHI